MQTTLCQRIKKIRDHCDGWHQWRTSHEEKLIVRVYYTWRGTACRFGRVLFFLHIYKNTDNARWRLRLLLFLTRVFRKPKGIPKVQLHGVSFMTLPWSRQRWLEGRNFLDNLVQCLIVISRNNCLGCAAGFSNLTLCITWSGIWAFLLNKYFS